MSEVSKTESKINVIISGDKNGFNSMTALHRFKQLVKSLDSFESFDFDSTYKKFLKPNYLMELINRTNNDVTFKVFLNNENNLNVEKTSVEKTSVEKTSVEKSELERKKELLRAKIQMMSNSRNQSGQISKTKQTGNVPSDIMSEYQKLIRMTGNKLPIPEPGEILSKPEEFRPVVSMVLGNQMMRSLGTNHPYVKYFRLLANKLGIDTPLLPIPTQNFISEQTNKLPDSMEKLIQMAGNSSSSLSNETINKANPLSLNDDSTDSEDSE
jgi:hypothetical protein